MLNPDDFKRAIQAVDCLGATPAVLVKVIELADDPNTDITTICEVLRNDGPLAADIIRIANSAYYAPATLLSNLPSAVNQIGLREVNRVVNLSLARQLFARDLCSYGISAYHYWSDSIASALVMEGLAKHTGLNAEDAYTVGILHAIGRVLINRVVEEKGFSVYWDGLQPIQDWERGSVGFNYTEAGAMLLEHWRFPSSTCDVIRWQLNPGKADEQVSLLGSLQFSQRLIALTGSDFKNKEWKFFEADPFLRASGLDPDSVSKIISGCRDDFQLTLQSVDLN